MSTVLSSSFEPLYIINWVFVMTSKQLLFHNWPLAVLSHTQQSWLLKAAQKKTFVAGSSLSISPHIVFLETGTIALHKKDDDAYIFHHTITEGNLIGLRESLLKIPLEEQLVAQTDITILYWDVETITKLIHKEPQFALAISRGLKNKYDLFEGINKFIFSLQKSQKNGYIHVESLIPVYKKMMPALHFGATNPKLDFGAWSYALNRLPQDLLQTHVYLVSTEIPSLLSPLSPSLKSVETRYRRRTIKKLNDGKSLVLVRDMHTDLIDFVSNLCVHMMEAKKLRRYLHKHNILQELHKNHDELEQILETALQEDWKQLQNLWPHNTIESLRALAIHHEDYTLYVEKNEKHHSVDSTERWISEIRNQCIDIGIDIENATVDIISSNRFVLKNMLCPYIHKNTQSITNWGKQECLSIDPNLFLHPTDYLYAIGKPFLEAHPEQQSLLEEPFSGFYTCNESSPTGIPVDIIVPALLDQTHIDPEIQLPQKANHIIINIDYAFGKQAEDIIAALISLFHTNIASINIMGKAGALVGNRGDTLLAKQVVLVDREVAYPMQNSKITEENPWFHNVHKGSILTVDGTLLQNKPLLHYFQCFWNCVGLEMEGSFYARQIQQAIHQQILSPQIETNFLYFVSDLPLQEGAQLSKDMGPHESIPPLYGIIRAFLHNFASRG